MIQGESGGCLPKDEYICVEECDANSDVWHRSTRFRYVSKNLRAQRQRNTVLDRHLESNSSPKLVHTSKPIEEFLNSAILNGRGGSKPNCVADGKFRTTLTQVGRCITNHPVQRSTRLSRLSRLLLDRSVGRQRPIDGVFRALSVAMWFDRPEFQTSL